MQFVRSRFLYQVLTQIPLLLFSHYNVKPTFIIPYYESKNEINTLKNEIKMKIKSRFPYLKTLSELDDRIVFNPPFRDGTAILRDGLDSEL